MDEKDGRQYVYYLIWYNLAAVLLVLGIAIFTRAFFLQHFISFLHPHLPSVPMAYLRRSIDVIYFALFLLISKAWLYDFFWIILVEERGLTSTSASSKTA
jgi:hypothetical protein